MGNEHRSDCWYKAVCQNKSCDGCVRFTEMSFLMENSGIPKSKQIPAELIPEDVDYQLFCELAEIKNNINHFISSGNNLFICSDHTGNGKTSWAIKLMLKYFDTVWSGNGLRVRGLFIHVPTFLMQLKNFENPLSEEYKQTILNTDLVVWDDIAYSDVSKYDYNNMLMFMDNRLFQEKSNIYTSNITSRKQLDNCLGVKLASRVWEASQIVKFNGKDRRS